MNNLLLLILILILILIIYNFNNIKIWDSLLDPGKKIFIVKPSSGLCNQLQTIAKTILLAKKYNRNIYFDKLQINIYNDKFDDFNNIISIDKLNDILLNKFNFDVKVVNNISFFNNIYKIKDSNNSLENSINIPTIDNIDYYIEKYNDKFYLDIGNPVSLKPDSYSEYQHVLYNIPFQQKFYDIANYIKKKLELNDYICMHLRLEDDALDYYYKTYNKDKDKLNTEIKNK